MERNRNSHRCQLRRIEIILVFLTCMTTGYVISQQVNLKDNERIPSGCEKYTLKRGKYASIYIPNFSADISHQCCSKITHQLPV